MDKILDHETNYVDPELYLASKGQRFANYILDRIGLYALIFLLVFLTEDESASDELSDLQTILFLLILGGYWVLTEYFFGKTPGKFLTGTKVVTKNGQSPSFATILGRTLCRFIPFEPFSFFGLKTVGWHDSISNTRVVRDEYGGEDYYV